MNLMKTSLAIVLSATLSTVYASGLDSAQAIQNKTNNASATSQKKIDSSAEAAISLKAEIEQLEEEVKNLNVYRDHLAALVENQNQEAISIEAQIDEIKYTRQGVVPLMYQMIEGLKSIVDQDKPIKYTQRLERIEKLEQVMTRADVSDAEKYRRILEAYQIEMDYGTKLGVYQGQINLANNRVIETDILHLGRISLVARNLSGAKFWAWDQNKGSWQALDSAMKPELDKAYNIATKQAAPSLITLPVSLVAAEGK
ncbi:DUF3450 domain-containing protein [Vibrio sp. Of7-15]|uniref:DUF3450 domain-containing protein n=1 Tax=Vibrio sp. Of7-15 TaxID=2724879 RepID=UPI001EF2DD23|nr:DUF3450 domain-containing protein [Vibrio sp. Of7-15]MCG7497979.1 DUF3450 domain-containing protein [Vibrio sp. Of7-15]